MRSVYVHTDYAITALGEGTAANLSALEQGKTGIKAVHDINFSPEPFQAATIMQTFRPSDTHTKLENLFIECIDNVCKSSPGELDQPDTLLILSTTKGNIDTLNTENKETEDHSSLNALADTIGRYFNCAIPPVVISNACISGLSAIILAQRYIASGKYNHIIVAGGDIISDFTVTGFQSFKALSPTPCRPFDKDRAGLSLGEGAAAMCLSAEKPDNPHPIIIAGGVSSNDANHISGPSRTGRGLQIAIRKALGHCSEIDYISAHGTGTLYNDEMEAKAFLGCALENVAVNSFKGYIGHTLGAAGVIESVYAINSLRKNFLYSCAGYARQGTSVKLDVIENNRQVPLQHVLKVGSGFGGCNAAILFQKV